MSGDKKIGTSQLSTLATMSESIVEHPGKDMGKNGVPSEPVSSVSSGDNALSGKGAIFQPITSEQGGYYPPTSCYDYYYPGYNGNFTQPDDKGPINTPGSSYVGIQQDNASLLYYVPGYGPYSTGFVGVDGKQAYTSSEYIQQPYSYGSDAFSCYTYDSTYAGNGSSGIKSGSMKSTGKSGSGQSNGFNVAKTSGNVSSKTSASPYNSKNQQPNSSRSVYQNQFLNLQNEFVGGFQSSGITRGIQPVGNYSSLASRSHHFLSDYGPVNYRDNDRSWNNNHRPRTKENFGRSEEYKVKTELTRGPRADNRNNSSKLPTEVEKVSFAIVRDKYNLQEFETVYDNAKFYVIKSYSEDDIHKCIKYDVWSSTPNGNKKLDAAFRDADAKTSETSKKCPVFLFFSVNGSGQFVGVAEMVGQVDFTKNMDFWQQDKWNGFFPLKWHIIKDVPNMQLRHIILENNGYKEVTYSRDSQEVALKQGLEMLSIFKNYSAKTCVLDDFKFYDSREKVLKAKRDGNGYRNGDYESRFEAGESAKNNQLDPSSLVALTKNLSLEPQPL